MKKKYFRSVSPIVNFPQLERDLLVYWEKEGIVGKYLQRNALSPKCFSFLDGPITANNPMGVHHAWGRTYKDLWQRFSNMRGYRQRFQNGFDCQGLWVEVEVEKELRIRNKKDIENLVPGNKKASIAKFVDLCKERVRKYSGIQTQQSERLGYFMDWDNSYYTMSDENNYMIWHFLKTCHEKGWIYKGTDSVPWCPRCETAISQHEMLTEDYKEVTHRTVYMTLPIVGREKEYLLVWTTTPWTIPANIAVAVDAAIDYSLAEVESGNRYWVATNLAPSVLKDGSFCVLKTVKGKELVGLSYRAPFDSLGIVREVAGRNPDTFHRVIATDPLIMPVTTSEGTGLVHTAVSAGSEDFKLGKKYKLPMVPVIADNADYLPGLGFLSGQNAKKHPEIILDYMVKEDRKPDAHWVLRTENYTHRYPACWRCKAELVWKVTREWYIAMDRKEKDGSTTLRQQMIKTAKMIDWRPSFGLERELDWLSNMHDWLISKKNRYWGLALPIYECENCGMFDVIGGKEELKERAVEGWDAFSGHTPHKPYIDNVMIRCQKCGKHVSRIDDVGNVWLDAGIVPFSTYVDPKTKKLSYTNDKTYWKVWFPADFITESFPGQFKNWFYSMIAMATVLEKRSPFKMVLGYGSMLGEDGRPMHKSWGNAIEFNEGADTIGVDVMRWTFVTQDPVQNLLFGYKKADETRRKFHLLLWNVYNFFITYANIDGWSPGTATKTTAMHVLDRWILSRLNGLMEQVTTSLTNYDAQVPAVAIENFVTDLSQWYVRRCRDRVGPTVPNGNDKAACHSTLYHVLVVLSQLLAPFVPFLSEEMYRNLTGKPSVHLATWPVGNKELIDRGLEEEMAKARSIVEHAHAVRKTEGIKVRQPLASLTYISSKRVPTALESVVADETNVKKVLHVFAKDTQDFSVRLDVELTGVLRDEGLTRELVRQIQMLRKGKGCRIDQRIVLTLPGVYKKLPNKLVDTIKRETLAESLIWGDDPSISIG